MLEITSEIVGASLDSGLGSVDGPLNLLWLGILDLFGIVLNLLCELVVAAGFELDLAIVLGMIRVAVVGATVLRSVISVFGFLRLFTSLPVGLLCRLVLFAFLWLILQDEGAELEARIDFGLLAACLAVEEDAAVLDLDIGLGILALLA